VAAKWNIDGYALMTSGISLDIDGEEKETALFSQSEKFVDYSITSSNQNNQEFVYT